MIYLLGKQDITGKPTIGRNNVESCAHGSEDTHHPSENYMKER